MLFLVIKIVFFQDIVLKVVLGTKKTKRRESSYTKIDKYAMENVRIVTCIITRPRSVKDLQTEAFNQPY